jgi:hypothetical protein
MGCCNIEPPNEVAVFAVDTNESVIPIIVSMNIIINIRIICCFDAEKAVSLIGFCCGSCCGGGFDTCGCPLDGIESNLS